MRLAAVVLAAVFCGLSLSAQSPASRSETREITDAFPANLKVDHFALSADGRRTYLVTNSGDIWLFDRARKSTTRLATGPAWDLNLSPVGDALAYAKAGERRGDQTVWVLPLDAATGLPSGAERRISTSQAGVPSVSPDGKLVAFARDDASGVGQSVVVAPIAGGTERVVASSIPSSLANIRWTPDGRTLYFGVNPPVACVPEWSCLPLNQELRQPPGTIRRVALTGGGVITVATGRTLSPGLSPDGTTLLFVDAASTAASRRWTVAGADGTRRDTVTLPPTQTPAGWLRGSTIILTSSGNVRRMRTMSLADGQTRVLAEGVDALIDPTYSPDGKLMSAIARGPHAELRILNADGSMQRSIALSEAFASLTAWSPDQRWIAYVGSSDTPPVHVSVVELATGRAQRLYELTGNQSVALRWLADSRRLVLTETFGRPDAARRVAFRTLDVTGATSLLKEFPLGPSPAAGLAIDETTAVLIENPQRGYRIVHLDGSGGDREVQPTGNATAAALGSLSSDGQWVALRHAPAADGAPAMFVDLDRLDGSARKAVQLPFIASSGTNPRVIPGSNDLLVVESRRADGGDSGVYLVSPATQAVRKLMSFSPQFAPPELALSPDGRTLVYLTWESVPTAVLSMDLSPARVR